MIKDRTLKTVCFRSSGALEWCTSVLLRYPTYDDEETLKKTIKESVAHSSWGTYNIVEYAIVDLELKKKVWKYRVVNHKGR